MRLALTALALCLCIGFSQASLGDRLPDFRECVQVCKEENCVVGGLRIPLHRRLLFWDCPSECDYICQHVVTDRRVARDPPMLNPVVQFHGKWPFYRFMGMQEPFSVLFSFLNFVAHQHGLKQIRESIPASYPLRKYYVAFAYFALVSWIFSIIFHARDFDITEKFDYFGAGASVLYGFYYAPIRIFRLDKRHPAYKPSLLRFWTLLNLLMFTMHVIYLSFWKWDYTYNMVANIAVGILQNALWSWFSIVQYRRVKRLWAAWPGLIVAWLVFAMSLELFDFPPLGGMLDAHCLWHAGTILPAAWWYSFLVKDAQEDLTGERLKA